MCKFGEKNMLNDATLLSVRAYQGKRFYYFLLLESLRKYEPFHQLEIQSRTSNMALWASFEHIHERHYATFVSIQRTKRIILIYYRNNGSSMAI